MPPGNVLTPFNTIGMYRGWITTAGELCGRDASRKSHQLGSRAAMSEPILIWGAGAIGGTIGAYWARAGRPGAAGRHRRRACARPAAPRACTISGPVEEFKVKVVPAVEPDELTGTYRRIVLAVKAPATAGGARACSSRISRPTASCSRRRTG